MLVGAGVTVTVGVTAIPLPVNVTVKGLLVALLAIVKVPVLSPAEEGEKLKLIVQVPFDARLEVQLLLWPKPLETDKPSNCSGAPPVFPSIRTMGELVVFIGWFPNWMVLADVAAEGPEATGVITGKTPGEGE